MLEDEYLSGKDFLGRGSTLLKEILSLKTLLVILLFLIFTNLFYLDISLTSIKSILEKESINSQPAPTPVVTTALNSCPQGCLDAIKVATGSAKTTVPTVNNPITNNNSNSISSNTKEYFIPFGSGSSSSTDWEDVGGLMATLDTNNYGKIKSVVLEATLHIPTANETAYVRLFNVTDKHPVWYSDLSGSGSTPQLFVSTPITLDNGKKTYQIQMKTGLQFEAILDQARLHIITY